jgi:hypothetical protein
VATVVVMGQLLSRQLRLSEAERVVLSAVGMGRRQIAADPVVSAAVPTLAGAAVAVVLAYLASGIFPTGFARNVEPHVGRRFETMALVPGAIALVVLVLGWVFVALVLADRPRPRRRRPTVVDGLARRVPSRPATALRFAFVRQSRDASGPRTAIVGMVAVVGLLVGALTFGASLEGLVDHPARWGDTYELGIGQGGFDAVPDGVVEAVQADPDVSGLALTASVGASVGTHRFDVASIQPIRGSVDVHVFEGRLPESVDEIAIGRVDARELHLGVGDDIVVTAGGSQHALRITGEALMPAVQGGDGIGRGGLVTPAGVRQLDPEAVPTEVGIRVRPGASVAAVRERLEAATHLGVGPDDRPGPIINMGRVRDIPYVVAAILGVLGLLNLGHQLLVSTQRRRRDLAVLRAMGADGRWVTGVVHWQATLFTLLVVALGAPLGIVLGRVLYRAFVDRIGALPTVTVPFGAFALTLLGLVALANVVATPNALRARRRPPSGLLSEE